MHDTTDTALVEISLALAMAFLGVRRPSLHPVAIRRGPSAETPGDAFSSEQSSRALGFADEIVAAAASSLDPPLEDG